MSPSAGAAGLFRTVGLLPDGPVAWGTPIRSRLPGVYLVELPDAPDAAPIDIGLIGTWLTRVPGLRLDGERPSGKELAARLASFWLAGESVLYIGRSNASLAGRVNALYQTPLGDPGPHAAGHWLKTLLDLERTRVWWSETSAAEEAELALLEAFAASIDAEASATLPGGSPVLPFANLSMPTGDRRQHGITGAVTAEIDGPAQPAGRPSSPARPRTRQASSPATGPRTRRPKAAPPTAAEVRAAEPVLLTADGMAALERELEELRKERRPAAIARVATARELGDLSENAEYHAAREELGFIEGRIKSLEHRHKRASVVAARRERRGPSRDGLRRHRRGRRRAFDLHPGQLPRGSAVRGPHQRELTGRPGDRRGGARR
jgi:hypothetical protein